MYGWEHEEWYKAQRARWDALESQGWTFSPPDLSEPGFFGIAMSGRKKQFYMMQPTTPEEAHMALLERCEKFAKGFEDF